MKPTSIHIFICIMLGLSCYQFYLCILKYRKYEVRSAMWEQFPENICILLLYLSLACKDHRQSAYT